MPRAGRFAVAAVAVLLLPIGALWLAPPWLDWERYRGRIAELASSALGLPVALDGPVTLALLPQPRLAAASVRVGGAPGTLSVAARGLRLRLAIGPLLAGRLVPREVTLIGGDVAFPWPPPHAGDTPDPLGSALPGLGALAALRGLDARCEACTLRVGELRLSGVEARLLAGVADAPLSAEARFDWRGAPLAITARLGRSDGEGAAPFDGEARIAGATLTATGRIAPGGGFAGRLTAAGPDLAALLPAPPGPFRANGRLTAADGLLAADELAIDLASGPATGALTLRLAPGARMDVALTAARLDLDAWVAALRGGFGLPLALGLDLSAEAARFTGVPLRRLRAGVFLQGDRLGLSDVTALLPGDVEVELAGATAGPILELSVRVEGGAPREALAALGVPVGALGPARLRSADARFRVALDRAQASVSELVGRVDGAAVRGGGVLRFGPRLNLGAGLEFDRLDLDGLLPEAWPADDGRLGEFDLNLRMAAGFLRWRGIAAERASLDATLQNGRLTLRRLALNAAGLDVAASGAAQFGGGPPRLSDLTLEASGSLAGIAPLLPQAASALLPEGGAPSALRLTGSGVPDAIAWRAESDLGELRTEGSGTLDIGNRRGTALLTLRHPGAPRLLAPLLGERAVEWLDPGSFALIAQLTAHPAGIAAESFDLTAGGLRARGALTLNTAATRPTLTGRVAADRLPLPGPHLGGTAPLPLSPLLGWDGDLALTAARLTAPGLPEMEEAQARLLLAAGTLRLEALRARLAAGGAMDGSAALKAAETPPRLRLDLRLTEVAAATSALGLPLDLRSGRVDAVVRATASGYAPAAMLATLSGEATATLTEGVLGGADLDAAARAATPADPDEAALRAALTGGSTPFARGEAVLRADAGRVFLDRVTLQTASGEAAITGAVDLAQGALGVRLGLRPLPDAPELGVRLGGPLLAPTRSLEVAPLLRWQAERR